MQKMGNVDPLTLTVKDQTAYQKIINAIIDYNLERLKDIDPEQIKKEQAKNNKAAEKLQKNQEDMGDFLQFCI